MQIEDEDDATSLSAAAKLRGNSLFASGKFAEALSAYQEAIGHTPSNNILYANSSACNLALAKDAWEPQKTVVLAARALVDARKCTELGPQWAKGYLREANAEFAVVEARVKWEERKAEDTKWAKENEVKGDFKLPKDDEEGKEEGMEEDSAILTPELAAVASEANFADVEVACRKGLELQADNLPMKVRLQALRDAGCPTDEAKDRAGRNPEAAAVCKAAGNKAFLAKNYHPAVEQYTLALTHDPVDHVFFSNRSACYASLDQPEKALADGNRCVALAPAFAKGYSRQGVAMFNLGRYPGAERAAMAGLGVDPNNAALQDLLKQAQVETAETPAAQAMMYKLRQDKKKDLKMKQLMSSLNLGGMGGNGMKVFSPDMLGGAGGGGGGGLEALLSGGSGGFGNGSKPIMTEEQMRQIARNSA